jgi:O-antigen ligase
VSAVRAPALPVRVSLWLVGLMWCLPFIQPRHYFPIPLFFSEWLAAVLGLAALGVLVLPRYASGLQLPRVALVPLALVVVLLFHLALLKAPYVEQLVLAMLYLFWMAALMVLGALLRREVGLATLATTLAWFLVAGGLVNAVAGILQTYELRGPLEPVIATKLAERAYGNLVQANHFADQLMLAVASLGLLFARGRAPVWIVIPAAGLLLFALALATSISVWLYAVLVAALAAALYVRERSEQSRRLALFTLAVLVGFAIAQVLAGAPWFAPPVPVVTATERLFEHASGFEERLQLWHEAILIFLQSPLLGVGFGQFAWHHFTLADVAGTAPLRGLFHNAHNIVLQLLAEWGAAGALILLAGMAVWLWRFTRAPFDLDAWWVLALLGVLALHSLVEYPLWYAYFLGIGAILFGAGEHVHHRVERGRLAVAGFAVLLVVGWLSVASLARNYYLVEISLFPRAQKPTPAEAERINRELLRAHGSLLTPYVELAFARVLDLDSRDIERKIQFSSRVMRFAPTGVITYQHSLFLALNGDFAQATRLLDRAVAVYPSRLGPFALSLAELDAADRAKIAPFLERVRRHWDARQGMAVPR